MPPVDEEADKIISVADQVKDEENEEIRLEKGEQSDVSRRRLRALSAITAYNQGHGNNLLKNPLPAETECCLKLLNFIKPYIPSESSKNTMDRVLPFCIMANDAFAYTDYIKF
ncbi:hypothetical protein PS6_001605 [Mucor atramentarius]